MSEELAINPLKDTKVFEKIKVGKATLSNRVVFAPTTRFRALEDFTPSDLQLKYYDDRSKYPGSLLTTEATFVSPQAGLYENVPGIWSEEHAKGWKKITDKVHSNGSFIAVQLWNLGRASDPSLLKKHGLDFVSSSPIYFSEDSKKQAEAAGNPLRALTTEEVENLVSDTYVNAAKKGLEAGFDFFELHAAHGYLLDQFLQPVSNKRTDKYGGSIENRARLVLELIDKLTEIVGANRLAIRISPWAKFQGMLAEEDEVHPIATFSYLLHELQKRADSGKGLAYVSIVEPRVQGNQELKASEIKGDNSFVFKVWKGIVLRTGNYTYDVPAFKSAIEDASDDRTLIGFSRYYTSNPDLIKRLEQGIPLTPYDRNTFYVKTNWGYNTFSKYNEKVQFKKEVENQRFAKAIE